MATLAKMIPLTKFLEVSSASHIVYVYEDKRYYIENLISYIKAGIERDHHLLIIENPTIYQEAEGMISELFSNEQQKRIHYVDNHSFYGYHRDFHVHSIVEHFGKILEPFFKDNIIIRTWAHVEWKNQDGISSKIEEFENLADCSVDEMGIMSVCAYTATDITASLQNTLMRSHEYLMTDKEFVRSTFYGIPSNN